MKLGLAIFRFFSHGGLQRDLIAIAAEAVRRGHEVTVYCMRQDGEPPPGTGIRVIPVSGWSNDRRAVTFARNLNALLMTEGRPDLLVAFNRIPGADLYFAGDNCFALTARRQHPLIRRLLPRYRRFEALERSIFTPVASTKIMVITERQQQQFQQVYHTPDERFRLLPPGISPQCRRPENAAEVRSRVRQALQVAPDELLLLQVGSGFRTKGVDRVIRALAALTPALRRRVRYWAVGYGSPEKFQKLAQRLGVGALVRLPGGRDDIPELLLAADLLVHPARNEAAGSALLEALAAGLPVVCTENCGFSPYVAASGGVVVPEPFSQPRFDRALAELLARPELLEELKARAITYGAQGDFYRRAAAAVDWMEELAHEA